VLTPCHIPSDFYRVKSESMYFFFTVQLAVFLHLQKNNEVSLTNAFYLFPHMNDSRNKSPSRLRYPPAQSSVKQLRRYYSPSCPWWKQCHSYASVGSKGVHSSRVIQSFVSWLSVQTQKARDKLMFTRTVET